MSTLIISQASAGGVALLAASLRHWIETEQIDDAHILCDAQWTLTTPFWNKTVPWLLERGLSGLPVFRVERKGAAYGLYEAACPHPTTVILLRMPRNSRGVAMSERLLMRLVERFGERRVIEVQDESLPQTRPVKGLRSCRLSNPPLLSLRGSFPPDVMALAGIAGACLYVPEDYAFPYLRHAHSAVIHVRQDLYKLLLDLMNRGPEALPEVFPTFEAPTEHLREGDAMLFAVRVTEKQRASLHGNPDTYLEHIAQAMLARCPEVRWGIAFTRLEKDAKADFKVVFGARYAPEAMERSLLEKLSESPSARNWKFDIEARTYYTSSRSTSREFRRMLTAVLPAFFPRLDGALRRQGLQPSDLAHVTDALADLEPEAVLAQRPGDALRLEGGEEWKVSGRLTPRHPAAIAAACLLGPTSKEDRIRDFYLQQRELELCRLWHNLKNTPSQPALVAEWKTMRLEDALEFCRRYRLLARAVRLPWPSDDFPYVEQYKYQVAFETLSCIAEATEVASELPDEFYDAVHTLHGRSGQRRGPGDEHFFSLSDLLTRFYKVSNCASWALGGHWDHADAPLGDALMWGPEVIENLMQPLWEERVKHAGPAGFMRLKLSEGPEHLELAILTSGPGIESTLLAERLRTQKGLATAARLMSSYGGLTSVRCNDGWFQVHASGALIPENRPRSRSIAVALDELPELEACVEENLSLRRVAMDELPDLMLTAGTPRPEPGWQAPCIRVGEMREAVPARMTAMTLEQATQFLADLRGFEVVHRFRRLSRRPPLGTTLAARPEVAPRRGTCLLVNDDVVQLAEWRGQLTSMRVLEAQDAEAAWKLWSAEGRGVDLVITDNFMPDENQGVDLARRLRDDGYAGPIVIATRAPSVVTDQVREDLTLSVAESDVLMRPDRLERWMRHVPAHA